MTPTFWLYLYAFAVVGHMATWVSMFNRLHATNMHRVLRRASYPVFAAGIFALPFLIHYCDRSHSSRIDLMPDQFWNLSGVFGGYFYFSLGMFAYTLAGWACRQNRKWKEPKSLISHQTRHFDFSNIAGVAERTALEKFFASIPGNQIYQCSVEERELYLPEIASCFDGLTLTHLSDLHFTGKICREYFEQVISTANELESDIVVITGDIIDSSECWPWLDSVLGKLKARKGIYYILGNHDERVHSVTELRAKLGELGFIDVANRWVDLQVGQNNLQIAGNELPWFGTSMSIPEKPDSYVAGDFKLLLSHSPDQWSWSRKTGFDLTLAGHTHGGQIQFPVIGPVISPSKHGVKYASGIFEKDGKIMIVSRGVSGEEPVRFSCMPELGKITIRSRS